MKTIFKKVIEFYINASIHVSLATLSLVLLTYYFSHTPVNYAICGLVFFGTIFSYNFIKYYTVIIQNRIKTGYEVKIIAISLLSFLAALISFFYTNSKTQLVTLILGLLSFFYVVPLGKLSKNLRNFSGVKIYIVSFCWATATLLLPLINANYDFNIDVLVKFVQRFIITLLLILIFEIKDLDVDAPTLKTFPQIFGVSNTKWFIVLLCIPFYVLEFIKTAYYANQWLVNLILVIIILYFTYFVHPKQKKYYTLFWVEAVPILWLLLSVFIN